MQHETLARLEALIAASQEPPETDRPVALIPNSCSVQPLEQYQDAPADFRGSYMTSDIKSFVDYATEVFTPDSALFINPDEMMAELIVDMGTPEAPLWGRHRAKYVAEQTPAFIGLRKIAGAKLTQRQMVEFIEDNGDAVGAQRGGKYCGPEELIHAVRNLEVSASAKAAHQEGEYSAARSTMEEIEIKAQGDRSIPSRLYFTCKPYAGLGTRDIECRMRVVVADNKPKILVSIVSLDNLLRSLARELQSKLGDSMHNDLRSFIGEMRC